MKIASLAMDVVRPPQRGLMVLAYHRVGGGTGLQLDLEPSVFDDQMAWLAAEREVMTLDAGVARVAGSMPDGPDPVVITFDDGTVDFIEHALPILVRHDLPATYYIATEFIDEQRPFPDDGPPMSWAALAEAVATGLVTIASHTHSHAVLDKLTPEQADAELSRARGLIQDRLGVSGDHFAYPKGVFGGTEVETVVARHHASAALAANGCNPYGATNPLRLERSPIQRSDSPRFFRSKVDNGLRFEGQMRNRINARRYAAASN